MNPKIKNVLLSLALMMASLAVCFVILEYVVARFYFSDVQYIRDKAFDETLGWRMKPGTYVVKAPQAIRKHEVHVNRYGLRATDSTYTDGKARRVLVLGDSFVFGKTTREADLLTTLMQSSLGAGFDVINGGVPGYGTGQQLLFMRRLAHEGVTADVYVLVMFVNDILDNLRMDYRDRSINVRAPGFVLDENGRLELAELPMRRVPREPIADAEATNDTKTFAPVKHRPRKPKSLIVLALRIEAFMQSRPGLIRLANRLGIHVEFPFMPALINGWYVDEVVDRGVPLMEAILGEVQREAARRGGKLMVALIPSSIQVYRESYGPILQRTFADEPAVDGFIAEPDRPQRIVAGMCERLGVPFLDLLPVMLENNSRQLYVPREGHFSRDGHRLAAQALSEFVADREARW